MSTNDTTPLAIRCIRPDLSDDRTAAEQAMTETAELLGYRAGALVVVTPDVEGPLITVMNALAATGAHAVIVPAWEHLYGIDRYLRDVARLISVAAERDRTIASNSEPRR